MLEKIVIGALDVEFGVKTENTMGSLASIAPVVCADTPGDHEENDINPPLATTDTYQFIVGLVGEDRENGGLTVGQCSAGSGVVSITTGQHIFLSIENSLLPANYGEAVCMAVFIKINNASKFQLCQLSYLEDGFDWNTFVSYKPLTKSPRFTAALLQSATTDTIFGLGSRVAYGWTFIAKEPTTGDVTELYNTVTVSIDTNSGPAFTGKSSVGAGLSFQLVANDIKDLAQVIGGFMSRYQSNDTTKTITQGHFSLATAKVALKGPRPVRVTYAPVEENSDPTKGLYLGLQGFSAQDVSLAWSKSAITPIPITLETAYNDKLLVGQHLKVQQRVKNN